MGGLRRNETAGTQKIGAEMGISHFIRPWMIVMVGLNCKKAI